MPRSWLLRQSIGYSRGRGHSLLCAEPPLARYNNVNFGNCDVFGEDSLRMFDILDETTYKLNVSTETTKCGRLTEHKLNF